MNDSSDADLSNEYTVEQLRASLKKSTNDLVMAANNKMNDTAAKVGRDAGSTHSLKDEEVLSIHSDKGEESFSSKEESKSNDDIDYDTLDVTDEIRDLFQCIDAYEPADLELDTPLKCFMPPYILAVGEVDPMIKIPRPDGVDDGIGIFRLDEVIASEQSNAAVIELQLRNYSKSKQSKQLQRAAVRKIKDAAGSLNEIDEWIQSVEEIHENENQDKRAENPNELVPSHESLKPFPEAMSVEVKNKELEIPNPDIDLCLADYARVLCSLTDIPVRDGLLAESIHTMFKLYLEVCDAEHTNNNLAFPTDSSTNISA